MKERAQLLRLWPFVRPHRLRVGLAFTLLLASFAIELVGPFLIRSAIDGPLSATDEPMPQRRDRLLWIAFGYLGIVVAGTAFSLTFALITARIGRSVVRDLRVALWSKLVRVDVRWHDQNPSGRVVTRVTTDLENLDELVSSGGLLAVFDLLKLLGILTAFALVAPRIFLLVLLAIPIAIALSVVFRRRARAAYAAVRTALADQNAFTAEVLGGIRTVRAYGREDFVEARYGERNAATRSAWDRTVAAFAAFFAIVDGVLRLAQAAILLLGGHAVAGGSLSAGSLVQIWLYFGKLQEPIRQLGERYHVILSALSSAERVLTILDQPDGAGDSANTRPRRDDRGVGRLTLRDVHFGYRPETPILRGIDLDVPAGRRIAIVGPTGAGKSTLLALLSRFFDPDQGAILLDGEDLTTIPLLELRRRVAVVPQEPILFDGSILDNIRLFDESITSSTVEAILERLGAMAAFRSRGGIAAPVGERGQGLSRGERQIVAFARALLRDPEVLVLDEATASVDSDTEARLTQAMQALRAGRTCLIVAHRLATVRDADEIVVLREGRIVERGRHEDLLASAGEYAGMHKAAAS
jgi:ATP-binding cassette subfamily B protein